MNKKFLLTTLSLFVFAPAVFAQVPAINPNCSHDIKVKSVPNGSGFYFSADCKTAFVLPPAVGDITIAGLSPSMALQQCETFTSAFSTIEALQFQVERLSKKMLKDAESSRGGQSGSPLEQGGPLTGSPTAPAPVDNSQSSAQTIAQMREIQALTKDAQGMLEPYKAIEAATGQLVFKAEWDKLVDAYQKANKDFRFVRMPMSVQALSYARKVANNFASMPAAFSVIVPGVNSLETALPVEGQAAPLSNSTVAFGESLSGQIVLTLAGACPFYDKSSKTLKKNLTARDLSAYFSANVQFKFNLQSTRKYSASYNLSSMVRRFQESGSKGGLFRSSSYSKLILEKSSEDWFKFTSSEDDPRFAFELNDLRAQVKADLITRVAKEIVRLDGGNPDSVPSPAAPGPRGAQVASSALAQNCPHLYCQAGAAALSVLDAIFGSSSATSEFINTNNHWAREDVNETRMVPFTGSYTFAGSQP